MVAGPAPAPVGAFSTVRVAAAVTVRALAAESVGARTTTKLTPAAVVMLVEPLIVRVEAMKSTPSQTAEAPEATVRAPETRRALVATSVLLLIVTLPVDQALSG